MGIGIECDTDFSRNGPTINHMPDVAPDAFGRAIRDHYHGERTEPLIHRDGDRTQEHPIDAFYFADYEPHSDLHQWLDDWLQGPLIDLGAGAGRHALHYQQQFETVAIEPSPALVETMQERGVADARKGDMFDLPAQFDRDRFGAALANGTQLGLARSQHALREFLGDLAYVTTHDATAVVDCYDPEYEGTHDILGYRDDPTPGVAHRVMWFEYDGDVDQALTFRLFSPEKLRDATVGTAWEIADIARGHGESGYHYRAALRKRND